MTEDERSKSTLPYAPADASFWRGRLRWLTVLTLINTMLLTVFIAGPTARNVIVSQWNAYQARKIAAAAAAQRKAQALADAAQYELAHGAILRERAKMQEVYDKGIAYTAKPGTLVYAEDAEGVAMLKAAGRTKALSAELWLKTLPFDWPHATAAADPPPLANAPANLPGYSLPVFGPSAAVLYVQGREQTPGGPVRLAIVTIRTKQEWHEATVGAADGDGSLQVFDLATLRSIDTYCVANDPQEILKGIGGAKYVHNSAIKWGTLAIGPIDEKGKAGPLRIEARGDSCESTPASRTRSIRRDSSFRTSSTA